MSHWPGARSSGRHKEAHDRGGRADSANRGFPHPRGRAGLLWALPASAPRPHRAADSRPSVSHARGSSMPPFRSPRARFCPAACPRGRGAASRGEGALSRGRGAGATGSAGVRAAAASPELSALPGPWSTTWAQLLRPLPTSRTRMQVPPPAPSTCPRLRAFHTGGPRSGATPGSPGPRGRVCPRSCPSLLGPRHSCKASCRPHPRRSGACSAATRH